MEKEEYWTLCFAGIYNTGIGRKKVSGVVWHIEPYGNEKKYMNLKEDVGLHRGENA